MQLLTARHRNNLFKKKTTQRKYTSNFTALTEADAKCHKVMIRVNCLNA